MPYIRNAALIGIVVLALADSPSIMAGDAADHSPLRIDIGNAATYPGYYPDYTPSMASRGNNYSDYFIPDTYNGEFNAYRAIYSSVASTAHLQLSGQDQGAEGTPTAKLQSIEAWPLLDKGNGLITMTAEPEAWDRNPMLVPLGRFKSGGQLLDVGRLAPPLETTGAGRN